MMLFRTRFWIILSISVLSSACIPEGDSVEFAASPVNDLPTNNVPVADAGLDTATGSDDGSEAPDSGPSSDSSAEPDASEPEMACTPESDQQFCTRNASLCGTVNADDNCGVPRSVECGTCGAGSSCQAGTCREDNCSDNRDNDDDGASDCGDSNCLNQRCNRIRPPRRCTSDGRCP